MSPDLSDGAYQRPGDWVTLPTVDSGAGSDAVRACGGVAVGVELQLLVAR
jgi:hypothetical protein